MPSLKQEWRSHFQQNLGPEGWVDVIRRVDANGIFANWDRVWDPGDLVESYFGLAVEVLCGDLQHPYASKFLEYAHEVAERAIGEVHRWLPTGDWGNPEGWPGRVRATLLRAKAFTDALASNSEPSSALVVEAAQLMLQECREARGPKLWTEVEQSIFLSGIQLLLIAGEIDAAKEAFRSRKSFNRTRSYHQWLKAFVDMLGRKDGPIQPELQLHFDTFFDDVRNPRWASPRSKESGYIVEEHNMLRIQLALIKQRIVLDKPIANHWNDVIQLIVA